MPLTPASTVTVESEMDFRTLLALFWRSAPLMIVIIFCCVLFACVYVVIAQKWYQAEVVLVPAEEKSIPLIPGQLGGLAALAGISIGGDGMEIEALAVLRSRDFAREFIKAFDLETVILNQRKRTALLPALNSVSRLQDIDDAVEYFHKKVLRVSQDPQTGLVVLAVSWPDSEIAAEWANAMASRLNSRMRDRALLDAETNLTYLEGELVQTNVLGLQQSISRLLEAEMQKLMLARGNMQFALRVVDSAQPPKRHARPNAILIVAFSLAFGIALSMVVVLLRVNGRDPLSGA